MTELPPTDSERWDAIAAKVKRNKGQWTLVEENPTKRQGSRNWKIKENLERRGLKVEVTSRVGGAKVDESNRLRSFKGVRTWARTI